ncbi:3755_t:CDS:1, partial [Dentiscutata erythropus]
TLYSGQTFSITEQVKHDYFEIKNMISKGAPAAPLLTLIKHILIHPLHEYPEEG